MRCKCCFGTDIPTKDDKYANTVEVPLIIAGKTVDTIKIKFPRAVLCHKCRIELARKGLDYLAIQYNTRKAAV